MSFLAIGFFASVPNLIGMGGNVIGGLVTDRLVKATGSVDRGRKIAFACAFGLGALSMAMPWVTNDYLAVLLMGLALFGNQWVAAAYIGTVGDVVPQQLAGRVNGIAGFGDNGAVDARGALHRRDRRSLRLVEGVRRRRHAAAAGDAQPVPRAAADRAGPLRRRGARA